MMIPFKKILAAVQVDSDSSPILDLAGALASWSQAELDLIHVFETAGYEGPRELTWTDGIAQPVDGEVGSWRSAQAMARMLERLGALGLPALRGNLIHGVVETTLVDRVHKGGFDLLIVGTHSHSRLEGLISGDVARDLVRICPCPLLIVPHA
jgi:nucleotide-binding universal stress UspA family protein